MTFIGANINRLNGGLFGGQTSDRVAVLVLGGTAVPDKLELNKKYELLQIEDAESLGITAASDSENKELNHYHLSEVFRLSPETSFHIIVVPKATKASELKNSEDFKTALRSIEGRNTIAVGGLLPDESVNVAVQGMQLLADSLGEDFIYIDSVLIEGRGEYIEGNAIAAFADLRALNSRTVTPIWAQDPAIATKDEAYAKYAGVGSALGMLLVRAVHEDVGSVDIETKPRTKKALENYPLTDTLSGLWLSASLSDGRSFSSLSGADQKKLAQLGYVYAGMFEGYGGYYFSGDHTCTSLDSDYRYIHLNAIWNKAARIIRTTLIPRVRSKVQSDPSTGYIKHTTITDWDGRVRRNLDTMIKDLNIARYDVYIDPEQAAVSDKPFRVKCEMVADGVAHEFDVDLGYAKSIQ